MFTNRFRGSCGCGSRAGDAQRLAGLVADDGVELADGNRAGQGDIIITRRNERRLSTGRGWVKNGHHWVVTAHYLDGAVTVNRACIPVALASSTLPVWYVAEHLDLGTPSPHTAPVAPPSKQRTSSSARHR
ncbi:hypothetical protein [Jiangella rhizosphaerae]|uniref:hypothetical protein n=1 Tax=Jiangella rhizosphaerae TaxID=2293569 RepID=UPI0011C3F1C6|nr:hypothetical protein [Jiangella rhizosphaerae]